MGFLLFEAYRTFWLLFVASPQRQLPLMGLQSLSEFYRRTNVITSIGYVIPFHRHAISDIRP